MLTRDIRLAIPLIVELVAGVLGPSAPARADDRQKQVLVLFSMRPSAQLAVVADRELPSLLRSGLSNDVDYYAEYIDSSRFTHAGYQRGYRDFLRLKYQAQRIDLLIAVGGVAVEFLSANRDMLFPNAPVVFYTLEPPHARMANSTGLVNEFHFDRSIDLALSLQPDLEHIYVVSGASDADREYERRARRQFGRFGPRPELTYLSGLPTRDLEARLATLPPHSALQVVFVTKDGAGENFEWVDYLARVASVANAPTYSWTDISVDTGIVGGHRRSQVAETSAIATLAVRVLQGERPDDIPISSLNIDVDQIDWRQLQRWGISEARVPAGTTVLFRNPTLWDRYKRYFIGTLIVLLAQTALIAGLLLQRSKRRQTERQLRDNQADLRESYRRIHHLGRQLLEEQEAERARIARELHDNIVQRLALLEIDLDQFRRTERLSQAARSEVHALVESAAHISFDIRALSQQLHPPTLAIGRLDLAIHGLCRDLEKRYRLHVKFTCNDLPHHVDDAVSRCLFRIAQETLQNVAKHSGVATAVATLLHSGETLLFSVSDEGAGFDVSAVSERAGLGLVGMRERLQLLGGELSIESRRGAGTLIRAQCPIHGSVLKPVSQQPAYV
jgi:signal transduction histidine kinase